MSVTGEQLLSLLNSRDHIEGRAQAPTEQTVTPAERFTVKTLDERGSKVFINICSTPLIPLPAGWPTAAAAAPSDARGGMPPEVVAYLTTGDLPRDAERAAQRALALPNRLSLPRGATDAGGAPCTVLDAAFHPAALAAGEAFRPLKVFIAQLALGEAELALGRQLDPAFKLPKMRAFRGGISPMAFPLEAAVGAAVQEAVLGEASGGEAAVSAASAASMEIKKKEKTEGIEVVLPRRGNAMEVDKVVIPGAGPAGGKNGRPVVIQELPDAAGGPATGPSPGSDSNLPLLRYALRFDAARPATCATLTVHVPPATVAAAGLADDPGRIRVQVVLDRVGVGVPGCAPLSVQLPMGVRMSPAAAGAGLELTAGNLQPPSVASAVLSPEKGTLDVRLPFVRFGELAWRRRGDGAPLLPSAAAPL